MADFESLKTALKDDAASLRAAAKTIRDLKANLDVALAAAKPEDVKTAHENFVAATTSADLQADVDAARKELDEAVKEAQGSLKPVDVSAGYPKTYVNNNGDKYVVKNKKQEEDATSKGFVFQS